MVSCFSVEGTANARGKHCLLMTITSLSCLQLSRSCIMARSIECTFGDEVHCRCQVAIVINPSTIVDGSLVAGTSGREIPASLAEIFSIENSDCCLFIFKYVFVCSYRKIWRVSGSGIDSEPACLGFELVAVMHIPTIP